jgi:hypothetical protein
MTDDKAKRTLRFGGTLTLPEAAAVRASLLAALQGEASVIELDCTAAPEVDVSFVQIALAARRTAAMNGKSITFSLPATGALRDALERGGFIHAAEPQQSADDAFWTSGSRAP